MVITLVNSTTMRYTGYNHTLLIKERKTIGTYLISDDYKKLFFSYFVRHASRSDCCVGRNSLNISVSDPILILKLAILEKNLICIRHRTYAYWIYTHYQEKIVMTGSSHEENEEFCKT